MGPIFSLASPGRNPISWFCNGMTGLASRIWSYKSVCASAPAKANRVLPVPAVPVRLISFTFGLVMASMAKACSSFLGDIPYTVLNFYRHYFLLLPVISGKYIWLFVPVCFVAQLVELVRRRFASVSCLI